MTQTSIFRSPLSAGQYQQWIEFPNEFKKTPSVRFFVVYKETPTIEPLILVKSVTTYSAPCG